MRFLMDVDDVMTRFVERMLPIIKGVAPDWSYDKLLPGEWDLFKTLPPGQRDAVFAIMERPGFCYTFKPAPGAYEAICKLRQLGCEVFAVTSPNVIPNWSNERILWLEKHMFIDREHVAQLEAKYLCGGDFFLDDRPDHVIRWAKEHPEGEAMLWATEHNCKIGDYPGTEYRVVGWGEVIHRVQSRIGVEEGHAEDRLGQS